MTASETDLMTTCPVDIEELAAFIDGRLTTERRARVIEHLDTCADCRDIVMTADEAAEASLTPNVVHGTFWKRALPAAAAAAIVTWLFLGPFNQSGMEKLVAAAENEDKRPIEARFSADFPYRDHSAYRGGGEAEPPDEYAMEAAAAKVADVGDGASAKKLHAAGVAWLHLETIPDHKEIAVQKLEKAAAKQPSDVAILTDLSAAYLATNKADRALDAANRALVIKKSPAALWNRAYALQILRRVPEARAAWAAYLQVDPSSQWATEVRDEHLKNLE